MIENSPTEDIFQKLSREVEENKPGVANEIRKLLQNSEDPSKMRYLEGLLLMLNESAGELEDPPDIEDDIEEYWEEY